MIKLTHPWLDLLKKKEKKTYIKVMNEKGLVKTSQL